MLIDKQKPHIHFADEIFTRDKRLNYESINIEIQSLSAVKTVGNFLKIWALREIVSTPSHSEDSISDSTVGVPRLLTKLGSTILTGGIFENREITVGKP